jgi:hypothetical protein
MPEVFLSAVYAAIFLFLIPRMPVFRDAPVKTRVFQWLFGLKLVAATVLYLIYTFYYTDRPFADIFRYFDDSAVISKAFATNPGHYFRMLTGIDSNNPELMVYYDSMRNWFNTELAFNDSRTMIRLCAFLRIFSLGTYFPLAVIMSFLALIGLTCIFRAFNRVLPEREFVLLTGIFLLPSTLLWTSGVIKEALLVFVSGIFLYQFLKLDMEQRMTFRRAFMFLIPALALLLIKSYFIFLMLPGIVSWLVFRKRKNQAWLTVLAHLVYYALIIFILPRYITGMDLPGLLSSKQIEFYNVAEAARPGSLIRIPAIEPTYISLLQNAPGAMLRTLSRPYIWEAHNPLMLLAGMENLVLNLFALICIGSIGHSIQNRWRGLLWSSLFLVISLTVLVGLVTPILGAMVRYRVPVLPFLIFVLAALPSAKWIHYRPQWLLK